MTMYVEILDAAIGEEGSLDAKMSSVEAIRNLLRCRKHLAARAFDSSNPNWTPEALAIQVSYDRALIEYARHLGTHRLKYPDQRRRDETTKGSCRGATL